jgi:hypothetical protein
MSVKTFFSDYLASVTAATSLPDTAIFPMLASVADDEIKTATTLLLRKTLVKAKNVMDYGAVGNNSTDDGNAINAAITAAGVNGVVYFPGHTYYSTKQHRPLQGQIWYGDGMYKSVIRGNRDFDYTLYFTGNSSTPLVNFVCMDLTIDADNQDHAACAILNYAEDCRFERVCFKNVAVGGWNFKLGVSDGLTETYRNKNNRFVDCEFDGHAGSLEMLLLFNADNTTVIRPRFKNNTQGPILGIWQKTYNTKIIDPIFENCVGDSIYYSVTCEETFIVRPHFYNCSSGVVGAYVSDNGVFGDTVARGLYIIDPIYMGGANSQNSVAINLAALDRALVTNPVITGPAIGIRVTDGPFEQATGIATNWTITNPRIWNCNQTDNFHVLHPGIMIGGSGGSYKGKILDGRIFDTQTPKKQRWPLVFYGAVTFNDIEINGTSLEADTATSSTGLKLQDGAILGDNVIVKNSFGVNPDNRLTNATASGTVVVDRRLAATHLLTLTGNITTLTMPNGVMIGDRLNLIFIQGGSGSYTVAKPTTALLAGGAFSLSTAVASKTIYELEWDGAKWLEIYSKNGLS